MPFGIQNVVSINGNRVRGLIKDRGLTNREVARRIALHEVSFSNLLGGYRNTTEQRAGRLAALLGVELEDIIRKDTDIAA